MLEQIAKLFTIIRVILLMILLILNQHALNVILYVFFLALMIIIFIMKIFIITNSHYRNVQYIEFTSQILLTIFLINIQIIGELTNIVLLQFIFFIMAENFTCQNGSEIKNVKEGKKARLNQYKLISLIILVIYYQMDFIGRRQLWNNLNFVISAIYLVELVLQCLIYYVEDKKQKTITQQEQQPEKLMIFECLNSNQMIDLQLLYFQQEKTKLSQEKLEMDQLLVGSLSIFKEGLIILQSQELNEEFTLKYANQSVLKMLNIRDADQILGFMQINKIQQEKNLIDSQILDDNKISESILQDIQQKQNPSNNSLNKASISSLVLVNRRNTQQDQRMRNLSFKQNINLQSSPNIKKKKNYYLNVSLNSILKKFIEKNGFPVIKEYNDFTKVPQQQLTIKIQIENDEKLLELQIHAMQLSHKYVIILLKNANHKKFIQNLYQSNKQKSKTISYVSHEFRTPLGCIITMLKQYNDETQTKEFQQMMNNIQTTNYQELQFYVNSALANAEYLLSLSNDLLDLAQIKVGKFKIQKKPFNLKQICKSILDLFRLQSQRKNIELIFDYSSQNELICSDQNRIKQIIINLLSNAFKFTSTGFIKLLIQQVYSNQVEIIIEDSGIGIKQENIEKLFRAFGKINSEESTKLNQQGVGLGLLISNMIASQLNLKGRGLEVRSQYLKGIQLYKQQQNYYRDQIQLYNRQL